MKLLIGSIFAVLLFFLLTSPTYAHQSGCHRWHSCPSDSGSYICGDTGYSNYCPTSPTPTFNLPTYTNKTITETTIIPYEIQEINDPTLEIGVSKIKQIGINGEKTTSYFVSYKNNIEDSRIKTSELVTKNTSSEIRLIGSKGQMSQSNSLEPGKVAGVTDSQQNSNIGVAVLVIGGLLTYLGYKFKKKNQ